jgi:hypothetical protein
MTWQQKIKHIKAILIDVDGTLANAKKQVTPDSQQTIKQLEQAGYVLGVATGRSLATLINYILPLFSQDSLHIVDDGASIVNAQGNYVYRQTVPSALVKQVGQLAMSLGANIAFSQDKIRYYNHDFYYHIKSKDKWNKNMALAREADEWTTPSLMLYNVNRELVQRLEQLRPELEDFSLTARQTSRGLTYSLKARGTDKGSAALIWANYQDLRPDEILMLGDSENDLEVMQRVGVSVAMGNAVASIKKAADVVTDTSDRDGLFKFAHQYLLT